MESATKLASIFMIGESGTSNQCDRVNKACLGKDVAPPEVSFLWKTHKVFETVPPTRPVCNATRGPIARSADLLSMVLTPIMRERLYPENCDSTEDMLHSVSRTNEALILEPEPDISVFSMDAKALFPSLDHDDILTSIWNLQLN